MGAELWHPCINTPGILVVFGFSAYPPCSTDPDYSNDVRPFEDSVRIVQSRIQIMNAFLFLLHSSMIVTENTAIPAMRVGHEDVFDFDSGGDFGGPINSLQLVPGVGHLIDLGRPWVIRSEAVSSACSTLDQILGAGAPNDLDMISLVHSAACSFESHEYSAALVTVWPVCEALVNRIWRRYIDGQSTTAGKPLTNKRRAKLTGRDYTASIIVEILMLAGLIPPALFDSLEHARQARNNWLHALKPVNSKQASNAIHAAVSMLEAELDQQIQVGLSLQINVP